jgi:predicted hotdog family 3-hydroxylacyl-ACP dehydratase
LTGPMTLENLVPHRGLMLLISEIIAYDGQQAAATAVVTEQWPLTTSAGADPLVLIELVAQTAAINNGWELLQRQGPEGDNRGWIVGIKSARLLVDSIPVGTTITIESRNQFQYDSFREIQGVARIGIQVAAEVTLQLIQAELSAKERATPN